MRQLKQLKQLEQLKQLINLDSCPIFIDEDYVWTNDDFYLEESDFYPPPDNRVWKSNIEDIEGGDNFADYCEEFFQMLDEEEYWEN